LNRQFGFTRTDQNPNHPKPEKPDPGQDLAEVVAGAAQQGYSVPLRDWTGNKESTLRNLQMQTLQVFEGTFAI
jgi:hypothetical protein